MKAYVTWKDRELDLDDCLPAGFIDTDNNDTYEILRDKARKLVCDNCIDIYVKVIEDE